MRRLVVVAAFVALLVVPAANAGGWATVRMAPPPAGIDADETWTAQLMVLRTDVTPIDGVDAVDHHPRRERLSDVPRRRRRRGRRLRRAGRLPVGGHRGTTR